MWYTFHMKTILVDAVYCFIIKTDDGFRVFEDMRKMLDTFPNRKILLTGAPDDKIKEYGLDKVPYEYFTLKQHPEKRDPEYYRIMLKHFGLTVDEVAYFEHNVDAVASARSVGITTYQYDDSKRDLDTLEQFLLNSI